MSFLSRLWSGEKSTPGNLDPWWYTDFVNTVSGAGMLVTPDTAMRLGTVYACVRVIAEAVASLPCIMYKRRADQGKDRATDHPLYGVLHDQPNKWQTAFEFFEMMTGHAAIRHNAYAHIVPGRRGGVDQLIPIHPARVRVEKLENHRLRYFVTDPISGDEDEYDQDEIFHLRGFSFDGLVGHPPTDTGKETMGRAMAIEQYGSRFFANDASPGGGIKHPAKLGDKAYNRLQQSFEEHTGVMKSHRPMIFEEGMEWQQIGLSAEDAQLIEAQRLSDKQVARLFRVQPHLIGILDDATFSNIEHQSREFLTHTIQPWLCRWQQAISRDLIAQTGTFFAEFLTEAMLRGDTLSRYQVYQIGRTIEVLSANDIRLKENMNPIEGGDDYTNPNVKAAAIADEDPNGTNQAREAASDASDEQPEQAHAWLPVILESAAERIARVQCQQMDKLTAKLHDGGDEGEFIEKLNAFADQHVKYVADVLQPVRESMQKTGLAAVDPVAAARKLQTNLTSTNWQSIDFLHWSDTRVRDVKSLIWETVA